MVFIKASALQCFNCSGVDSIDKCTKTITCGANEHCHARKYIDANSNYLYDVNCRSLTLCSKLEQATRDEPADSFELEMWTSCCAEDNCNMFFDTEGFLIDASKRVMECYSCQGIADPADCTQTTVCKEGEVCLTHEKINGANKVFDMGCLPRAVCGGIGYYLHLSKRESRHVKRVELCRGCCDQRGRCNNQFCSEKLGNTDMSALGTPVVMKTTAAALPVSTTTPAPTEQLNQYHLIMTPSNQTGAIGSTVVFDCEFDKSINESMTVSWYFKDKSGNTKRIYTVDVDPPALDFYVKYLSAKDEGEYTCEVQYKDYTWRASATLLVPGFLEITKGPDTLSVKTGQQATFTCEVDGLPKPSVRWELLHNSPHPTTITKGVTMTATGSMLVIDHVSESDTGVYRCVANSAYGTTDAMAVLSITNI